MLIVERQLVRLGVRHVSVREPDAPYNGELTAIGLCPLADRSTVKPLLSRLRLFGKKEKEAHAAAV